MGTVMGRPQGTPVRIERVDDVRVAIRRQGRMRVDGLVYATDEVLRGIVDDPALSQVANVACLPGILDRSIAMPDIHWGYGFPIGGVAAFDLDGGVVSPGGVGYDINCGVRLLRTDLAITDLRPRIRDLVATMFTTIPTGVGSHQRELRLSRDDMRRVAERGASWAIERGMGSASDLDFVEERGRIEGADFDRVSERAFERGRGQLGTLGSGNHFAEIGYVATVEDPVAAAAFGLFEGGVTVTIHTGSRGFGHQVCTDAIPVMDKAARAAGIELPDRQLACAPIRSAEGQAYLAAMACAANFAFANRQIIADEVCRSFERVMGRGRGRLGMRTVYDVAHNIAKVETHLVAGKARRVCVHRKGATRSLPAGHPDTPAVYASVGQPVLVPGDMGRASWVLVGLPGALDETFGSSCHGAGRVLSRHAAMARGRGRDIASELASEGIVVMASGRETIDEEMPEAYKDVGQVVDVVHRAGIAGKVAMLRPVGVIKG
jgi:tRNA-splicing ligase RtcB